MPDPQTAEHTDPSSAGLAEIRAAVLQLRQEMEAAETEFAETLVALPDDRTASAANLVHYITLRKHDLRDLQDALTRCGLSSLGGAEPHIGWTLDAILALTAAADANRQTDPGATAPSLSPEAAWSRLERNTVALLGQKPPGRTVRIMVTMPSEAAAEYELVLDLVSAGMDCMRINCAHDGPEEWESMIRHLRRAEDEAGRSCRVLMDLPGPRVRTGPIEPGPEVVQIDLETDELGRVVEPARIWLTPAEASETAPKRADHTLPLPGDFLATLRLDDTLAFHDATGGERTMKVDGAVGGSRWAELSEPAHITTGTRVELVRPDGDAAPAAAEIGQLPAIAQDIWLKEGDSLVLIRGDSPGRPPQVDPETGDTEAGRIGCLPPSALERVKTGERIWFDDGRIGGVVEAVSDDEIIIAINRTRPGGDRLRPEKGINLPDSDLRLPPLTEYDLELLPFLARNADLVGYSFVGTAEHVGQLRDALDAVGGGALGIVLKIEREIAFRELPKLLLEGMKSPNLGVMIARGDLAVECGFARMAEVQEEILWLCAAAHVPVIWATQVMEQLAKKGRPSRAEVTDAAMGGRAECVMLNKGPHITDAVRALISVLGRMQEHQHKKRARLRRLEVASHFFAPTPEDPAL